MNILFIHQNFPGQFKSLAPALALQQNNDVRALTMQSDSNEWQGVKLVQYRPARANTPHIHPWVHDIESKVVRGEAAYYAACQLRNSGFIPDVIVAHPGWGESLFLKTVWPSARLGIYCEYYYQSQGADVGFDPEFVSDEPTCRIQIKNMNNLLHLEVADAGISPTHWQAGTFPERFRSHIRVIHDGIDTDLLVPNSQMSIQINESVLLTCEDEVITFVNRNLEPYRGYHLFMRSLPKLLQQRPNAHVILVGGAEVSYGAKPKEGNWKDIFYQEILPQLNEEQKLRIHFVGNLPYAQFLAVLQLSSVHVYLSYPFVLSWSLLEAMSVGCAIVASDTASVREAIVDGVNGRLIDFFDYHALADAINDLLENPHERQRLGNNAREFAIEHYDLKTVCLPAQLEWIKQLYDMKPK